MCGSGAETASTVVLTEQPVSGQKKSIGKYSVSKKIVKLQKALDRIELSDEERDIVRRHLDEYSRSVDDLVSSLEKAREDAIHVFATAAAIHRQKVEEEQNRLKGETEKLKKQFSDSVLFLENKISDLYHKTRIDPMTALLNWGTFDQEVITSLQAAKESDMYALGIIDIKNFKFYNDNFGHQVGDQIISAVGNIIKRHIRTGGEDKDGSGRFSDKGGTVGNDLKARVGGDEFGFLLVKLNDFSEVVAVYERFRNAIENYSWQDIHPGLADKPVRINIGLVVLNFRVDFLDTEISGRSLFEKAYKKADELMYMQKFSSSDEVKRGMVPVAYWLIPPLEDSAQNSVL